MEDGRTELACAGLVWVYVPTDLLCDLVSQKEDKYSSEDRWIYIQIFLAA